MNFVVGVDDEVGHSELSALKPLVVMGYQHFAQSGPNKKRTDYRNMLPHDRLENAIRYLNPKYDEQIAILNIISDIDLEIQELEIKRDKHITKNGMKQKLLAGEIRLL